MAISKSQTQVEWSGADTKSVSSSGNATSDAVVIADTAIAGSLTIKADHSGSPASGDEILAGILYTTGDPDVDPDSADEYDTPGHALPIVLDTNTENPAIKTIPVDTSATGFKLFVENDGASSITVSAQYSEQTG